MPPEPGLLARGPWDAAQVQTAWRDDTFVAGPDAEAEADAAIAALRERGSPSHDGLAPDARDSMTVLCVVRSADGRWLAGRRADWVASWAGRWALGAGGSVEVNEDPVTTLSRELEEEWSVAPARLTVEALVRLPSGLVSLIGLAHLLEGAEAVPDDEHDAFAWWPADPEAWPEEAHPALRRVGTLLESV